MAKSAYLGVSGKARKVMKMYIGIDGKARKVKKVYIGGSDNKARLCWSSGVTWKKYKCNVYTNTYGEYIQSTGDVGRTTSYTVSFTEEDYYNGVISESAYNGYTFSSSNGFSGEGGVNAPVTMLDGAYSVSRTHVYQYSVEYVGGAWTDSSADFKMTMRVTKTCVAHAYYDSYSYNTYSKSTYIEDVTADAGAVPGGGSVVEGSATGSYCVVYSNGTYYYYVKA